MIRKLYWKRHYKRIKVVYLDRDLTSYRELLEKLGKEICYFKNEIRIKLFWGYVFIEFCNWDNWKSGKVSVISTGKDTKIMTIDEFDKIFNKNSSKKALKKLIKKDKRIQSERVYVIK